MNVATPRQRLTPTRAATRVAGRWSPYNRYRVLVYSLRRLGRESPAADPPARRGRG